MPSDSVPPAVRVELLGTTRLWVGATEATPGARLPKALLAMLALDAGHAVPFERLIDDLWAEEPPDTARTALQVYVGQLRRALGTATLVLRTEGSGYRLAI